MDSLRHGFCHAGSRVGSPSLEGPVGDGGGGLIALKGQVEVFWPPVKFFRISC